mmetsp:Transcript_8611/g.26414  ORF Transcript_8611/g.26414 Transcript_8611/m.26414 type:complete len:304 (+) Transcript_8611:135-1046(+)
MFAFVVSFVLVAVSRGLSVPPQMSRTTSPRPLKELSPSTTTAASQSKQPSLKADALKSSLFAVGLCVLHAASPGLCGVALALDAGSYSDLYGSSATGNEPSFSFNLPKAAAPAKKRQEAPPAETFGITEDQKIDESSSTLPKVELPKVDLPKVPSFSAPKVDLPKVDVPSFSAPKVPKVDVPSFSAPKVDLPSISAPKVDLPKVDLPSLSAPSLPSFGGGGDSTPASAEPEVVDREAIDQTARETASEFRAADAAAKEVESQGRKLRSIANEKKKAAKVAKDAACEYRPGGKFLCIRGFNSGF